MNGRSQNSTAIDAVAGKVMGTIPLPGKPEFSVSGGRGGIFVNIEDKSELVRIDAEKLTVTNTWPLAPCESPSGLSMDRVQRRLFSGCANKLMAVVERAERDAHRCSRRFAVEVHGRRGSRHAQRRADDGARPRNPSSFPRHRRFWLATRSHSR